MAQKRVAIYARVSTDGQSTDNQIQQLEAAAKQQGWLIVKHFVDHGISGAKGRDQRPAFDALLKGVVRKDFDLIMTWSVDRLGRSLQDLVAFLNEIHSKKVDLYLHVQGLDTSTPVGRMMFQMLGVFSEFERSLIRSRVIAGLQRAKAQGKAIGRPRVNVKIEKQVLVLRRAGKGICKIAKEVGIGVSTVKRIVDAQAAA